MKRWNSINAIIERGAGRVARAHLRNAMEAGEMVSDSEVTEVAAVKAVATARIFGCADIVAAIYGLHREDVLDLTRREMAGEDVEPK